jgi:hypothetical protein
MVIRRTVEIKGFLHLNELNNVALSLLYLFWYGKIHHTWKLITSSFVMYFKSLKCNLTFKIFHYILTFYETIIFSLFITNKKLKRFYFREK